MAQSGEERDWTGWSPAVSPSAASPGDLWAALISLRLICISGCYPGREGPDHSHRLDNCRLGMSKLYDRMCRVNIDLGREGGFTLSHRQFLRQGDWKDLWGIADKEEGGRGKGRGKSSWYVMMRENPGQHVWHTQQLSLPQSHPSNIQLCPPQLFWWRMQISPVSTPQDIKPAKYLGTNL